MKPSKNNNSDDPLGRVAEKAMEVKDSVLTTIFENFAKELQGLEGFNSKIGRTIRTNVS